MNFDNNMFLTVNNSNFSSNNPELLTNKSEIRRYIIKGSRRFSNFWWATIVFLGSFGFLVTGISSYFGADDPLHLQNFTNALWHYQSWQFGGKASLEPQFGGFAPLQAPFADSSSNKVELSTILFFPQGLVMCFYGVLGLFLSFYLWFTIFLNIGAGFNEICINSSETNQKKVVKFNEGTGNSINKKKGLFNPSICRINSLKNQSSSSSMLNKTQVKKFQKNSSQKNSIYFETDDIKRADNFVITNCLGGKAPSPITDNVSKTTKVGGQIKIFRWGFPGKNRQINLQYSIDQVSAIKLEFLQGLNSKRTISLKLSDQREILLTGSPQGEWETFEQLEKQASDLAKYLKVNLELLS